MPIGLEVRDSYSSLRETNLGALPSNETRLSADQDFAIGEISAERER